MQRGAGTPAAESAHLRQPPAGRDDSSKFDGREDDTTFAVAAPS